MKINAYAKINLRLRVLGRRADGFHELENYMQAVSLHDDVDVQWLPGGSCFDVELSIQGENGEASPLPCGESNLAYRAATLVRERFGADRCGLLKIGIVKRIPIAAGLAGGSADGAAVLTALKTLWDLSEAQLLPIAADLGSDVPFSFMAQNGMAAAIGRGRGTELEEADPIRSVIVLYNPGYGVSTPAVYRAWDELDAARTNAGAQSGRPALSFETPGGPEGSDAVTKKNFFNDLQAPALFIEPRIRECLDRLGALEPAPQHVQLSGSGPTVFALYPENTDVEIIKKGLQRTAPRAIIVEPLRKIHL